MGFIEEIKRAVVAKGIPHCNRPYDNMCVSIKNNNNTTCGSPTFRGNSVILSVSRRILETCKTIQVTRLWHRKSFVCIFFLQISSRIVFNVFGAARSMCFSCQKSVGALTTAWHLFKFALSAFPILHVHAF